MNSFDKTVAADFHMQAMLPDNILFLLDYFTEWEWD